MSGMDSINEAALMAPCPYVNCRVIAGRWCRTKSGADYHYLHAVRTEPFRYLYHLGWNEGYNTGVAVGKRRAQIAATLLAAAGQRRTGQRRIARSNDAREALPSNGQQSGPDADAERPG